MVVPAGATCTLTNAQVQGNVQVQARARLLVTGPASIRGDMVASQCAAVQRTGAVTVGGNVELQACGYIGPGIQIGGNLSYQRMTGACVLQRSTKAILVPGQSMRDAVGPHRAYQVVRPRSDGGVLLSKRGDVFASAKITEKYGKRGTLAKAL